MTQKTKLFLSFFILSLVVTTSILGLALPTFDREKRRDAIDYMLNRLELTAQILEGDQIELAVVQIENPSWVTQLWVSSDFKVLHHNLENSKKDLESIFTEDVISKLKQESAFPSSFRVKAGKSDWAQVPLKNSAGYLLGMISGETILRYRYFFIFQTGLILLFFVSLSYFFSWWFSHSYTKRLSRLTEVVDSFQLQSEVTEIKFSGRDEISKLAVHFSSMALRLKRNLLELEDKFRMKNELKTAQQVQKFLFPSESIDGSQVYVGGLYRPASECGGDWLYYTKQNSILHFMIGDVTGHGTSSALMTSCCRGVISILLEKNGSEVMPSDLLRQLNSTIFETAGSQLNMTFFAARFDLKTGILVYSNASHELPVYFNKNEVIQKPRQIAVLEDVHGPRLGEKRNPEYSSTQIQLAAGDRIILHSDGLFELTTKDTKVLGERGYLKLVAECNTYSGAGESHRFLCDRLEELFHNPYPDDISLVYFEWKGNS